MKRLIILFFSVCLVGQLAAQPKKSRIKERAEVQVTDRASLQFPTDADMPEDVSWKRDIYRQLDLTTDKNAPLYYPVEPQGRDINIFTLLFRLMLDGKIPVYEYGLDGNESFLDKNKIKPKDFLEKYQIYYEMNGNRMMVNNSDIPSAEVKRMYLKESVYFDQRTSSFHRKVTALCPVMVRDDDFGTAATPYPLFWVRYSDVAPYFSRHAMMSSNYNNVSNMSAADFFAMNRYEGKIYKTTNLQGKVLANYCKTDSALVKEQNKIEKELKDVENHVWGKYELPQDSTDSVTIAEKSVVKEEKRSRRSSKEKKQSRTSRRKSSVSSRKSSKSSSGSSAPRVSVRRQRR